MSIEHQEHQEQVEHQEQIQGVIYDRTGRIKSNSIFEQMH